MMINRGSNAVFCSWIIFSGIVAIFLGIEAGILGGTSYGGLILLSGQFPDKKMVWFQFSWVAVGIIFMIFLGLLPGFIAQLVWMLLFYAWDKAGKQLEPA